MSIKEQILADLATDIKNRYALDKLVKDYKISFPRLLQLIANSDEYKNFNNKHNGKRYEEPIDWTDDKKLLLAELYKAGKSYAEIGIALGVSETAVNAKISALRLEGVDYLPQRKGWTRHGINTNM
ncbi:MAG: helix-turn-helix domain-containing protein [Eubacteriales bacterium]